MTVLATRPTTLERAKAQEWEREVWAFGSSEQYAWRCPTCKRERHQGHGDGCVLAELVRELAARA